MLRTPSMLCRAQLSSLYPGRRYAQEPNKMLSYCNGPPFLLTRRSIISLGISAHIAEPISPFTNTAASPTIDSTRIRIKCSPSISSTRQVQFTGRRIDLNATSTAIFQQHSGTLVVYDDFSITARIHLIAVRALLGHVTPMPIQCNADRI